MRALRVIGLDESGNFVVCEDATRRERFQIPADERLRAAARGDVTRLGQIEIELESAMRPREIQTRIRAGESVEQVSTGAGMSVERVERYAYPVLLERSRTAELAQRAHPVREDGPDVQTLSEVTAHAFGLRGQDYAGAAWDSWRGDDSRWVVQLTWRAGRSENRAHWVFAPGAHGGTVSPLDEQASNLMNPKPDRQLRTVRVPGAEPAGEPEFLGQEDDPRHQVGLLPAASTGEAAAAEGDSGTPDTANPPDTVATQDKRGNKSHPIVPSWEDVLLGVRSNRG
ncbi:MAG: septation protein SepH [Sciscionella sp.]